jgi:hypothetical protein
VLAAFYTTIVPIPYTHELELKCVEQKFPPSLQGTVFSARPFLLLSPFPAQHKHLADCTHTELVVRLWQGLAAAPWDLHYDCTGGDLQRRKRKYAMICSLIQCVWRRWVKSRGARFRASRLRKQNFNFCAPVAPRQVNRMGIRQGKWDFPSPWVNTHFRLYMLGVNFYEA